jgi:hypothetical protein
MNMRDSNPSDNAVDFQTVLEPKSPPPELSQTCTPYAETFKSVEQEYNLPPNLLKALAMHESSCLPGASNPPADQGQAYTDCGILQVRTAGGSGSAECTKLKNDTRYAIEEAAKRLIQNCGRDCQNTSDMVAAFNGGHQAVTSSNDCGPGAKKYECCLNSGEYGTITQKEVGNVVSWQKSMPIY